MGHCITVYQSNGEPLPSYSGEPFILPLYNSIDKNLTVYWEKLNVDRRISILVKFVNLFTQEIQIAIKNKLSK